MYRIEPRPYEEMEYWYRFYYDFDYSNVLSVDKSYGNSFYDNSSKEKRYEEIKNVKYRLFGGFESVVLPLSLKHIADSACVGVVDI